MPDAGKPGSTPLPPAAVHAAAALLLCVLVFALYSVSMHGPFVLDDLDGVRKDPRLHVSRWTPERVVTLLTQLRPLARLSFALNYTFHGHSVFGYHLVNTAVHALASVFLYLFLLTLFRTPVLAGKRFANAQTAFACAAIWAVHPVNTQAVSYVVQRMTSMSGMFMLLSLLLFGRGLLAAGHRKARIRFAGCAVAALCALGSKEIAATLPFFLWLYAWYFHADLSRRWLVRWAWVPLVLLVVPAAVLLQVYGDTPLETFFYDYRFWEFTPWERTITGFRTAVLYVSLMLFPAPSRLSLEYHFPPSGGFLDPPTTLAAAVLVLCLVAWAVWAARRHRLLSFCVLWFFGNLVIEGTFLPLDLVFEHRVYVPAMTGVVAVVVLAHRVLPNARGRVAALCAVLALLSFWTLERNRLWADDLAILRDAVDKAPERPRAHFNVGFALAERGLYAEALPHYRRAVALSPTYFNAYNALGVALARLGRMEQARETLDRAAHIQPSSSIHTNLGNVLLALEDERGAWDNYRQAIGRHPDYVPARENMARLLLRQGKVDKAVEHIQAGIAEAPENPALHNLLGVAFIRGEEYEYAVAHLKEAVRISPDMSEAHRNLGNALLATKRVSEALEHYERSFSLNPDQPEMAGQLGRVLVRMGMPDEAVPWLRRKVELAPDSAEARNDLGVALARAGRHPEAVERFEQALALDPKANEAKRNLEAVREISEGGQEE
ncbi:MAG: tetratricopeptide repeat protein [Desulfatibacillaceae bacterium]